VQAKLLFTTKENGMGMGLSICRSIIENHDGKIWVSSSAKRGSIFHLELPTTTGKDLAGTRVIRDRPGVSGRPDHLGCTAESESKLAHRMV
jgi:hypothetical protein